MQQAQSSEPGASAAAAGPGQPSRGGGSPAPAAAAPPDVRRGLFVSPELPVPVLVHAAAGAAGSLEAPAGGSAAPPPEAATAAAGTEAAAAGQAEAAAAAAAEAAAAGQAEAAQAAAILAGAAAAAPGGPSRYRGVVWHRANSKWEARVYESGKQRFLGYFETEAEAAAAHDEAAGAGRAGGAGCSAAAGQRGMRNARRAVSAGTAPPPRPPALPAARHGDASKLNFPERYPHLPQPAALGGGGEGSQAAGPAAAGGQAAQSGQGRPLRMPPVKGSSRFRGVSWSSSSQKWRAQVGWCGSGASWLAYARQLVWCRTPASWVQPTRQLLPLVPARGLPSQLLLWALHQGGVGRWGWALDCAQALPAGAGVEWQRCAQCGIL